MAREALFFSVRRNTSPDCTEPHRTQKY